MASTWIPKIEYGSPITTITFEYPPKGPKVRGQQINHSGTVTEFASGKVQTVTDYIEEIYSMNFSLISETIKGELETFFSDHALLGKEFTYYFDKDDAGTAVTVKLDRSSFKVSFDEMLSTAVDEFRYKFKIKIRRVRP